MIGDKMMEQPLPCLHFVRHHFVITLDTSPSPAAAMSFPSLSNFRLPWSNSFALKPQTLDAGV
jgi:hypothetical protein